MKLRSFHLCLMGLLYVHDEADTFTRVIVILSHAVILHLIFSGFIVNCVKVQREALAESSVVFGRVFGNKVGRRLTV